MPYFTLTEYLRLYPQQNFKESSLEFYSYLIENEMLEDVYQGLCGMLLKESTYAPLIVNRKDIYSLLYSAIKDSSTREDILNRLNQFGNRFKFFEDPDKLRPNERAIYADTPQIDIPSKDQRRGDCKVYINYNLLDKLLDKDVPIEERVENTYLDLYKVIIHELTHRYQLQVNNGYTYGLKQYQKDKELLKNRNGQLTLNDLVKKIERTYQNPQEIDAYARMCASDIEKKYGVDEGITLINNGEFSILSEISHEFAMYVKWVLNKKHKKQFTKFLQRVKYFLLLDYGKGNK